MAGLAFAEAAEQFYRGQVGRDERRWMHEAAQVLQFVLFKLGEEQALEVDDALDLAVLLHKGVTAVAVLGDDFQVFLKAVFCRQGNGLVEGPHEVGDFQVAEIQRMGEDVPFILGELFRSTAAAQDQFQLVGRIMGVAGMAGA